MAAVGLMRSSPNCPNREDGLSYSTQVFPSSFSYSSTLRVCCRRPNKGVWNCGLRVPDPFVRPSATDSQWGVQARPDVMLRHLEGEQGIADDVLDRLPLLT